MRACPSLIFGALGWSVLCVAAQLGSGVPAVQAAEPAVQAAEPGASGLAVASAAQGTLALVTYNVAGLPEGISRSHPLSNLALIGSLLNQYDLALVQEDFAYPLELRRGLGFAHASPAFLRGKRIDFGDGLSEFSRVPFSGFEREAWATCNGYLGAYFDCLTPKGFTVARHELAPGVFLDVYDVHLDAGNASGDVHARDAQLLQLNQAILRHSAQMAVIVAGDTNIRAARRDLRAFEQRSGLSEACEVLQCAEPRRVDRVFFRDSPALELSPISWKTDARFVDAHGNALSDHLAVAVDFKWRARPAEHAVAVSSP